MILKDFIKAKTFVLFTLLILGGFFPAHNFGQETVLRGIVHDQQGNPLQKVKITLFDPSRGTKFALTSNKKGEFIKIGIPPSSYKITFELEGYFPFESQLTVRFAIEEKLDITLEKIPPKIDEDKDFNEGIDFFKQGKYKEAIDSFLKAADKFPDSVEVLYNLGVSYLRSGNSENAISTLEKAIQLKQDIIEVYFALGECYFTIGKSDKAMEAFSKAIDFQPNNAKAYYNLGIVYYKYDKTDEAIGFLEKAIELDPAFSSAYYQAGLVNIKKGDLRKAIKYFEDFLKLEPNAPETNQVKTMIEELKKQIKLA